MRYYLTFVVFLLAALGRLDARPRYSYLLHTGAKLGENGLPQIFAFDTGLSQFWVTSARCRQPECLQRTRYDYLSSYTYQSLGEMTTINYGDLGQVRGRIARDKFEISDATIEGQTFVEALNLPDPEVLPPEVDGVIGMDLCTFHDNATYKNPMKLMNEQGLLEEKVFSLFLNHQSGPYRGIAVFGRPRGDLAAWDPRYVPVTHPDRWQFQLTGVATQRFHNFIDRVSVCPDGCQAVINTGMPVILGPRDEVRRLNQDIGAQQQDDGSWRLPRCNLTSLPVLTFKTEAINIVLWPRQYVIQLEPDNCLTGIFGGSESFWVLGQNAISSDYVVFDYGNKRIGFAEGIVS